MIFKLPDINVSVMTNQKPHIIHIFPSFGRGGVPIKICHSINYFGEKARHTIISTNNDYGSEELIDDGLDVAIDKSHHDVRGSLFSRIIRYRAFLKQTNADLLITYNWGTVEWALANSFGPIIRHIHVESGFGPEEANGTMKRRNFFRRFALRNIDCLSVPSNTLITIAKEYWKISDKKIKYIPNGVDLDKYSNAKERAHIDGFNNPENDIIVGTIAPLRPEKNLSRLIRCFDNTKEDHARLIIVGEGVERRKLEKLVEELKIEHKVFFAGHISSPENAIGLFDIFAISSDTEQMPNSVNEAMAAGLPIVGTDVGDVKHIVCEKNKKYIVPASDEAAYSMAMKNLINDHLSRETLGAANLEHVKVNYDRIEMYKKYASLWGIA